MAPLSRRDDASHRPRPGRGQRPGRREDRSLGVAFAETRDDRSQFGILQRELLIVALKVLQGLAHRVLVVAAAVVVAVTMMENTRQQCARE